MAFRMAGLTRTKSGTWTARKGIPKDVRAEYQRLHGRGWEELFTADAGETRARATVLWNEWHGEIVNRIATIRATQRGEGHDLTQRQAQALAGEWYQWFTSPHKDNPGEAHRWAELAEVLTDAILGATPEWDNNDPRNAHRDRAAEPEVRECVHPMLADEAKTAQFLASKGEVLTSAAMATFLNCLTPEFLAACDLLQRRASGDYAPDTRPQTFPEYSKGKPVLSGSGKTCHGLFEAYVNSAKPAASTVNRWRCVFPVLEEHLAGRTIDALSDDEAQRWITGLITGKRSARTVNDVWAAAVRRVFSWALKERHTTANPFAAVSVTVPRQVQNRDKEFTEAEVRLILKATLAITDTRRSPFKAACRWVPWLCAYSGARAGEITQLRGQDVEQRNGFVAMKLTPDAGTIKGAKPRTVPIHPHVIEQGFMEYVKSKGRGPLFYTPATETIEADVTNPRRPRAVKARERLAAWVRELGVTDKGVSPTHAWRHTFKRRAARAKIEKGIRDFICGHATKAVADDYETPSVEDMANALRQFPRYVID